MRNTFLYNRTRKRRANGINDIEMTSIHSSKPVGGKSKYFTEPKGKNVHDGGNLWLMVHDELRKLADRHLRNQRSSHTLQPTALVHEAYLRLAGDGSNQWESRAHFFSVAAKAMRSILIDHARRRNAIKRGAKLEKLPIDGSFELGEDRDRYLVVLDDALNDLASMDAELARVVELRFFGGLTVDETAEVMGVSGITVKRTWKIARGWLYREMTK